MYLKKTFFKKTERTYLSIVQGYRQDGKSKSRTIKKIGYLDEFTALYDDPIAHFTQIAVDMTNEYNIASFVSIDINTDDSIDDGYNLLNVGYLPLKHIYHELQLSTLFKKYHRKSKIEYSLDKIFQLLSYSRILYPNSKRATFENRNIFFQPFDNMDIQDIYKTLGVYDTLKHDIQQWIWVHTKDQYKRDVSSTYYDCTNYYFEIPYNDADILGDDGNIIANGLRKRGPEKNKRPDPIVQMGLLMDASGIPLAYDLFPGNESEKTSLRPIIKRTKAEFGIKRTIVVADRGLNTSDNMYFLAGKNDKDSRNMDGYVYGQSIRVADKEFQSWALDNDGFISTLVNDGDKEIPFLHKSRKYGKAVTIKRDGKRNTKVTIYQKQLVYYSPKYALKQKKEREQLLKKAESLIKNPGSYTRATSYGAAAYVNNINFDKKTGEVIVTSHLSINTNKIEEDARFDGYYSIVTSEDNLSDIEIRNIYRGLIKIEDTFRVSKTEFDSRPVHVWTAEHIEGHFLTCFVSLVMIRLLEKRLDNKYSVERIIGSLKKYNCINIKDNIFQFLYQDEIIRDVEKAFNVDLSKKYKKREEIKKLLKY